MELVSTTTTKDDRLYQVTTYSSYWHDGEQPMEVVTITGKQDMLEYVGRVDGIESRDLAMWDGIVVRVQRIG
jgi:hypothetical protein